MPIEVNAVTVQTGELSLTGSLQTRTWERRDRLIRALKVSASCFGLALVALCIPVLHFVLTPLLILFGVLALPLVYLVKRPSSRGEIICPKCKGTIKVRNLVDSWPLQQICPVCEAYIAIQPTAVQP